MVVAVVVVFHKNMVSISYASRRNLGRGSVSSGQSGSRSGTGKEMGRSPKVNSRDTKHEITRSTSEILHK